MKTTNNRAIPIPINKKKEKRNITWLKKYNQKMLLNSIPTDKMIKTKRRQVIQLTAVDRKNRKLCFLPLKMSLSNIWESI